MIFAMLALTAITVFAEESRDLHWQSQPVSAWAAVLDSAFSDEPAPLTRQWYAAYALGQYGEKAKSAVPAMITRLETAFDRDNYVRAAVARSLGMIGDLRAVPALMEAVTQAAAKDDESVLRNAAWALGTFGGSGVSENVVPVLEPLLTHDDIQTRAAAAAALWHIIRHEAALETLVALLRSSNANEIYEGAMAVAQYGTTFRGQTAVITPLVARLRSANPDVPPACQEALCSMGKPVIPAVKAALSKTTEPAARARLVAVLGTLDARANTAMLLELADNAAQAEAVRIAAVRAIRFFPPGELDTARETLVRIINDTTSPPGLVREAAALMKML